MFFGLRETVNFKTVEILVILLYHNKSFECSNVHHIEKQKTFTQYIFLFEIDKR